MAQMYTSETESLHKKIENLSLYADINSEGKFKNSKKLTDCIKWIRDNDFRIIALQFPDSALPESVEIYRMLSEATKKTFFILGDTTYESCCVDFVAAEHVSANALVHFGKSCKSKIQETLPVFYISLSVTVNVSQLSDAINAAQFNENEVILVYSDEMEVENLDELRQKFRIFDVAEYSHDTHLSSDIIFIGNQSRTLNNFCCFHNISNIHSFNLDSSQLTLVSNVTTTMKRNYFLVEKLKDAKIVGIVVATLVVDNYLTILERIQQLCKLRRKKSYVFSLGRPQVAKLANFPEVDIFVVIACKSNEIFNSRDFYQPLVTPYLVEVAFNPNFKNPQQIFDQFDFNELVSLNIPIPDEIADDDNAPDISLISGKIRATEPSISATNDVTELLPRADMKIASYSNEGAQYLAQRSWKGLEQNLGQDVAQLATLGREGTAKKYVNENGLDA